MCPWFSKGVYTFVRVWVHSILVWRQDRWKRNFNLLKSQIISSFDVRVVLTGESRRNRTIKCKLNGRNWQNDFLPLGHLKLKCWCQLLTHLIREGREELHRRRRRRRVHQGLASDPVKSSISSANTNSKSKANLLPFIVMWKLKLQRKKARRNTLESFF